MSMPHNFSDDPNSFSGPPANSNNTTVILVAIAIVCGTLMLICGGVIFGVVMTVRQAQQEFEQFVMDDAQLQAFPEQSAFREYNDRVASGRYSEALESVDAELESDPNNAMLHNNKAWLLATCPDEAVRDGELAVKHATKACELTNWSTDIFVDTIAAAYAEAGDFEAAVKWQAEAIRLSDGTYSQEFQKRLRLFKAGKPYREGVAPYSEMADEPPTSMSPVESQPIDPPVDESTDDEGTDTESTDQQLQQ